MAEAPTACMHDDLSCMYFSPHSYRPCRHCCFPPSNNGGDFIIHQNTIHYVNDTGCFRFTEDHLFVPCDQHFTSQATRDEQTTDNESSVTPEIPNFYYVFYSYDGHTYATDYLSPNEIYRWDADAANPWVHFATLDNEIFNQYESDCTYSYTVSGQTVYVLLDPYGAGPADVYAFDIATGQGKKLYTSSSLGKIFPYPDENKVAVSTEHAWPSKDAQILLIDKNTLEIEKMLIHDNYEDWTRFTINEDGTGYATDYHHLYQIKDGKATELRKITEDLIGTVAILFPCPFHDDEVMYSAYLGGENLLFILPTTPGGDEVRPLVLAGYTNEMHSANPTIPSMLSFIIQHDNLTIEYADYPSTFDEVAQSMMAKNDTFDVMLFACSNGDLKKLYQRGFACNLSEIPELDDYFASLYPVWRDACSVDGSMFAMPLSAYGMRQLMRNTALWDELSLGEVPTTYDQLFDCIQRWDEQGVLEQNSLFGAGRDSYQTLFWKLITDYIVANDRQGSELSFQHETFQHLMARLSDLRPILEAHDAQKLSGDMLIYPDGSITSIKSETARPILPVETLEPMPIQLSDSLGCVEQVNFYVLMINPYSTQRRVAEEFLIYMANHLTVTSQCLFINDGLIGYESETQRPADDSDAYSPEAKASYEEYLAQAIEENNSYLIQFWRDVLAEAEEKQGKEPEPIWNISPEEVTKYQTVLPHLAILQHSNYQLLFDNGLSIIQQYLEGRLPLDQMCRRLDDIVRMNAMED